MKDRENPTSAEFKRAYAKRARTAVDDDNDKWDSESFEFDAVAVVEDASLPVGDYRRDEREGFNAAASGLYGRRRR